MSVLRRALERRSLPPGYGESGQGQWLDGMRWESWSTSTPSVGQAMQISAVFACLRLLSEAIATLPLNVFTRADGERKLLATPEWLRFEPPHMSRVSFLSQVMLSLLTDGNAFVFVEWSAVGPVQLIVMDPAKVTVGEQAGRKVFRVEGQLLDASQVVHIAGMQLPGELRGVSPLAAARSVIDGGRKAQEFGSSFLGNAAVPPAVIEMPGDATGDARSKATAIAKLWNDTHGGTANAGKVGVLMGGATLKTIAISPQDAEWLESKRFGVSEIARFYGVPPHLIADASNSTSWGSGLAEQNLTFGQFALRPYSERIEEGLDGILHRASQPEAFVKLNLDALLRASLSDRYASYAVGIGSGFLTPNEARRFEDLPPLPGGDEVTAAAVGGA